MRRPLVVPGHALIYNTEGGNHPAPARFTEDGTRLVMPAGPGCAKCQCGELSPVLGGQGKRSAWHRVHREDIAGVPWA